MADEHRIIMLHIGPFTLHRVFDKFLIFHQSGEGGQFSLSAFTEEVCPWDQVEKADEEKVRRFYAKWF